MNLEALQSWEDVSILRKRNKVKLTTSEVVEIIDYCLLCSHNRCQSFRVTRLPNGHVITQCIPLPEGNKIG